MSSLAKEALEPVRVPRDTESRDISACPERSRRAKRRLRELLFDRTTSAVLVVLVVVALEAGSRGGVISPLAIPAPSSIAKAFIDGFKTGVVWPELRSTMGATLVGFGLAIAAGVIIGGLLAVFHRLERVIYPFIVALQTLPKIAIAPLIILWFGFGVSSKIVVVAVVAFFPILVNTMQGLRLRERDRYELMKSLGANNWQVFRYVRFPSALPYIFAGLHIGIIFSLIGAVAAEFVGSSEGLGVLMIQQKAVFNIPGVFAVLFIFMIIGVAMESIMGLIERRVAFWAQEDKAVVSS